MSNSGTLFSPLAYLRIHIEWHQSWTATIEGYSDLWWNEKYRAHPLSLIFCINIHHNIYFKLFHREAYCTFAPVCAINLLWGIQRDGPSLDSRVLLSGSTLKSGLTVVTCQRVICLYTNLSHLCNLLVPAITSAACSVCQSATR